MRLVRDTARVRVVATSANLGSGFDSMGLALDLADELEVRAITGSTRVFVQGQGAGQVPTDDSHLVVKVLNSTLESLGSGQIGVELHCKNRIPHGRGLGSSAAAVVAGILLAKGLIEPDEDVACGKAGYTLTNYKGDFADNCADPACLNDDKHAQELLDAQSILQIATQWEGHPDNAAPAILGGATVAWIDSAGHMDNVKSLAKAQRLHCSEKLQVAVLIPNSQLSTSQARGLLPSQVPHCDAAFNVARSALLVHALGMSVPDRSLLFEATADRLHQEYRQSGMPDSLQLLQTLRLAGLPAVISGAGPTVLVFAHLDADIQESLTDLGWQYRECAISTRGSHLY